MLVLLVLRIVIGVVLGGFIGMWAKRNRIVHKGPSSNQVKREIYHDQITGKYYRFEPFVTVCPPSIDVTVLEHSDEEEEDNSE